jgi:hypothetical protein
MSSPSRQDFAFGGQYGGQYGKHSKAKRMMLELKKPPNFFGTCSFLFVMP